MVRRSMRRALLLLAGLGGLVLAPAAHALLDETPVLTSARQEVGPAAGTHATGDGLLAFARSRPGNRNAFDAYLRRTTTTGTSLAKLNAKGQGFAGGIDSPTVAYHQVGRGRSDIKLYDVDTGTRSNPPSGVNTPYWEFRPMISGDWLAFTRAEGPRVKRIILFNLATREKRVVDSTNRRNVILYTGELAGDWFVWFRCAKTCNVVRYNIASRTRTTLPKPAGRANRQHYGPSVTSDGVVYLGRSASACGASVKLVRFFGDGDPATGTVLVRLPAKRDFFYSNARENADGSTDVFYDRGRCARRMNFDVYRITDPAP